ncbi:hypothetical protein JKP88DRAFT_281565 [Tribonema minus]|uniref:Uncharacterized protein n=1 Tax=Tribonema minus TaxID=303371 RepID=A0A836C9C0_9STRA|nr:hypothetical protein JKP88DRAFT_281565 [Tribonema minus]
MSVLMGEELEHVERQACQQRPKPQEPVQIVQEALQKATKQQRLLEGHLRVNNEIHQQHQDILKDNLKQQLELQRQMTSAIESLLAARPDASKEISALKVMGYEAGIIELEKHMWYASKEISALQAMGYEVSAREQEDTTWRLLITLTGPGRGGESIEIAWQERMRLWQVATLATPIPTLGTDEFRQAMVESPTLRWHMSIPAPVLDGYKVYLARRNITDAMVDAVWAYTKRHRVVAEAKREGQWAEATQRWILEEPLRDDAVSAATGGDGGDNIVTPDYEVVDRQ